MTSEGHLERRRKARPTKVSVSLKAEDHEENLHACTVLKLPRYNGSKKFTAFHRGLRQAAVELHFKVKECEAAMAVMDQNLAYAQGEAAGAIRAKDEEIARLVAQVAELRSRGDAA